MKRLLLTLCLLFLFTGCMIANGDETVIPSAVGLPANETASALPVLTAEPTTAAPTTEPPVNLEGVELVLSAVSRVVPEDPFVRVSITVPQAELPGAADRGAALTLALEGETAAAWPELELEAGLRLEAELLITFERYQPDRTVTLTATLRRGEEELVREARVDLVNDPDEVYAQRSGDPKPYAIDVLRNQNVVVVYGKDEAGSYAVPVKVWLCSTGPTTPRGNYRLGYKREWGYLFGGVCGQYVCTITGDILFHSVPYARKQKDTLVTEEYNKLGTPASMGCVRLAVGDVKWIYDNCPMGTPVHIFDTDTLTVERPERIPIDPDDPRACWDPTDPDEANPWNQ